MPTHQPMQTTLTKTIKQYKTPKGRAVSAMTIPNSDFFKFEIINWNGASIERTFKELNNKTVYGISHLIEHMSFKSTRDYESSELLHALKMFGQYNASTDFDRINYWYQTISDHKDFAINITCNIAFNDLKRVNEEEYELERNVVYNEVKRYNDDAQNMFHFNTHSYYYGWDEGDNVLGLPENINSLELQDCIDIKSLFLCEDDTSYIVVYDPCVLDIETILNDIDTNVDAYGLSPSMEPKYKQKYAEMLTKNKIKSDVQVSTDTEQIMVKVVFEKFTNIFVTDIVNRYISSLAKDVSLNDYIREQNGLTYGIHFYSDQTNYTQNINFTCDVTKGNEGLLMELFHKSINDVCDTFTEEKHNEFISNLKLKTKMGLLDQSQYITWAKSVYTKEEYKSISHWFEEDVNTAVIKVYAAVTFDTMKEYLETFKAVVNNKDYIKILGTNDEAQTK